MLTLALNTSHNPVHEILYIVNSEHISEAMNCSHCFKMNQLVVKLVNQNWSTKIDKNDLTV